MQIEWQKIVEGRVSPEQDSSDHQMVWVSGVGNVKISQDDRVAASSYGDNPLCILSPSRTIGGVVFQLTRFEKKT